MQQTLLEMNQILINRYFRLSKLRQLAMDDKNIQKKKQADLLMQQVTERINYLTHFSYDRT
jgi:hypothetical protein